MEVAQSLPLLLPFRKNICENSDCVHFSLAVILINRTVAELGFSKANFAVYLQEKNLQKKCISQGCLEQNNLEKFPICFESIKCENVEFSSL